MKFEFQSNETPKVRIYDFDNTEARKLKELFIELAEGEVDCTALHKEDLFEDLDGCSMTLRVGSWDKGIKNLSNKKFEWILTEDSWKDIANIAELFCDEESEVEEEWLETKGDLPLLISRP